MTTRTRFRIIFALCVLLLALGCWWIDFSLRTNLRPAALFSGGALFLLILALTAFNARKKLPFLPLLKASTWMQFHIYAGWLCFFLYLLHTGSHWPKGLLETTLVMLFASVTLSGVVGLAISRYLPARLTLHGEPLIFERIPALRMVLHRKVEELAIQSLSVTKSSTIVDFYEQHLRRYFEGTHGYLHHLTGNPKPLHRVISQIEELERYCNDEERRIMAELTECARQKDHLDFNFVNQGVLKLWLFVHIPLTFALILCGAAHGLLAWCLY